MQITRRDPKQLTVVGKRIQNAVKELKELDGGKWVSWNYLLDQVLLSELIFSHQNITTPKEAGDVLNEEKKKQWSNNKKERDFVKLMESKAIMIVVIVL